MEEIKFGQILENACRLAGRNPSVMDIPADWKVLAGMAIESGIHAIAAEKFPLMQRVEFRRYRPDWADGQHYSRKMEVWHGERYWRLDHYRKEPAGSFPMRLELELREERPRRPGLDDELRHWRQYRS